jgi:hypothetical protein
VRAGKGGRGSIGFHPGMSHGRRWRRREEAAVAGLGSRHRTGFIRGEGRAGSFVLVGWIRLDSDEDLTARRRLPGLAILRAP